MHIHMYIYNFDNILVDVVGVEPTSLHWCTRVLRIALAAFNFASGERLIAIGILRSCQKQALMINTVKSCISLL